MENKKQDLVSVVLPTYNSQDTINKTLDSILKQVYNNLEILVIDDNSTDQTVEIIKAIAQNDPRIKIILKKTNKGVAYSRNIGISEANGTYVAFLDSDDIWPDNKVSKQVAFMQEHNVYFSYSDYYMFDVNSNELVGLQKTPKRVSYLSALTGNVLGCSSVMFNKEKVGVVAIPNLRKRNDAALWLKILKITKYGYRVPGISYTYNIRSGSLSSGKKYKLLKHHYIMYRESQGYNPVTSALLSLVNVLKFVYKKIFYYKSVN